METKEKKIGRGKSTETNSKRDREDRFFCSASLNLLHDLNSSICNE